MSGDGPRYVPGLRGEWWGVWDTWLGVYADNRRWLACRFAVRAAARMNHPFHDRPEAGGMSTTDGLGS